MAENLHETAVPEAQPPALSVGAILRAEREARGLSVEEIAERVKYSVRQIGALEQDDVEHLPQGTFLRGFVRSYARVLGMDEAALLAGTLTRTEHLFDVTDVQAGGAPLPQPGDESRRSHYLMFGALIVVILLAVIFWLQREEVAPSVGSGGFAADAVGPASAVSPVPGGGVKEAEPVVVRPPANIKPAAAVALISPRVAADAPKKPAQPTSANLPEAMGGIQPESSVSAAKLVPLELLMKRPIRIVFNETAWMEIVDVNGEVLLSRITQAGDEKWIGGANRAPYRVTIGRPTAIRMYYHGEEVNLSQYNPAGIAKLVLE